MVMDSKDILEGKEKSDKFYVIMNSHANSGRLSDSWDKEISKKLDSFGVPYELSETKYKGHATLLAEEAVEKYPVVVAAGGDGTINEVVNGLLKNGRSKTAFGVIPAGFGNDFAKNLNIKTIDDSIIALNDYYQTKENSFPVDAGSVDWNEEGLPVRRYFCSVAGICFDAEIVQIALEKELKNEKFDYQSLAFQRLLKIPSRKSAVEIISDYGKREFETRITSMNIALGKTTGRIIKIAPKASNRDGFFDITLMKDASSIGRLILFPIIIAGLHPYLPFLSPWVEYFDSREKITGVNILAEGIPFQAEGEYFGKSPARFSMLPGAIDAIYKKK
jgi:diacylglycerol kinase (ATP)